MPLVFQGGSAGISTEAEYQAVGVTSAPTTTSGTFVVIPEMTLPFTVQGNKQFIMFSGDFTMHNGDDWNFALFLDAVEIANTRRLMQEVDPGGLLGTPGMIPGFPTNTAIVLSTLVVGSSHTVDVRWAVTGGTARATLTQRALIIQDIN